MKRAIGILLLLLLGGVLVTLPTPGLGGRKGTFPDDAGGWGGGKVIEERVVEILKGEIAGDREEAERQVVETVLALTELTGWPEHGSLRPQIIFGDVHPSPGQELIAAVSSGKDHGVVGVFAKGPQGYAPVGALKELVPVTRVGVVDLPGLPHKALVVDHYLDEMFGAFFEARTKAVYVFRGGNWEKAWERDRYRQEYCPEGNELKGNQTRWLKLEERVDIVFLPGGRIEVTGVKTEGRSKTLGDLHGDYEITGSQPIKESYAWDPAKGDFQRR